MFQALTIEHGQNRTTLYPFGPNYKVDCIYLEADGSYIVHKKNSNKMGQLDKPRDHYSLVELQELCKLLRE